MRILMGVLGIVMEELILYMVCVIFGTYNILDGWLGRVYQDF
ncbi:hypothetical protein HanRHA438_Chr06g0256001 [Helianthus annuus]|nr:hypothetical protein HanIR_Chr06g0265331 [Helianthus annuus]KAJ0910776.1 hypothetical protein HanRHA438_Chr06g0256001 [Helianthus annuus]